MKVKAFNEYKLSYTNKFFEKMTLKLDSKENILFKHDDITSSFIPLKIAINKYVLDSDEQSVIEGYMKLIMEMKKSIREVI